MELNHDESPLHKWKYHNIYGILDWSILKDGHKIMNWYAKVGLDDGASWGSPHSVLTLPRSPNTATWLPRWRREESREEPGGGHIHFSPQTCWELRLLHSLMLFLLLSTSFPFSFFFGEGVNFGINRIHRLHLEFRWNRIQAWKRQPVHLRPSIGLFGYSLGPQILDSAGKDCSLQLQETFFGMALFGHTLWISECNTTVFPSHS